MEGVDGVGVGVGRRDVGLKMWVVVVSGDELILMGINLACLGF